MKPLFFFMCFCALSFSVFGQNLFFNLCDSEITRKNHDDGLNLYQSNLQEDSSWSIPQRLGKPFESVYTERRISLTNNLDTAFFRRSAEDNNFGASTVYFTHKNSTDRWEKAVALPKWLQNRYLVKEEK